MTLQIVRCIARYNRHVHYQYQLQIIIQKSYNMQQTFFFAFCSFFPCSQTQGQTRKSGSRQGKYNLFIFQPEFNTKIPPKNATKHPVAQWHDHVKNSGLNPIFCCLKLNQFITVQCFFLNNSKDFFEAYSLLKICKIVLKYTLISSSENKKC